MDCLIEEIKAQLVKIEKSREIKEAERRNLEKNIASIARTI